MFTSINLNGQGTYLKKKIIFRKDIEIIVWIKKLQLIAYDRGVKYFKLLNLAKYI